MDNRNEASIHCRLIWLKKRLICYQNVNSSSMVNFDCAQFDNRFEAPSVFRSLNKICDFKKATQIIQINYGECSEKSNTPLIPSFYF
jgi:hypothetical protein